MGVACTDREHTESGVLPSTQARVMCVCPCTGMPLLGWQDWDGKVTTVGKPVSNCWCTQFAVYDLLVLTWLSFCREHLFFLFSGFQFAASAAHFGVAASYSGCRRWLVVWCGVVWWVLSSSSSHPTAMPARPSSVATTALLPVVTALLFQLALPSCRQGAVQLKDPGDATSFAEELYEIITPDLFVIRLFHRDGWTGSHTVEKLANQSQALYGIATPADLDAFTSLSFDRGSPKAVFVNASMLLNPALFDTLEASGKVSAVFVQFVNTSCETAAQCPAYGVSYAPPSPLGAGTPSALINPNPDYQWVPAGQNTVLTNFSFPIFRLPDQASSDFAAAKANANVFSLGADGVTSPEWPYVAAEPHLYFGPQDMTSSKCLTMSSLQEGKKYCDPLGGQSVWSAAQSSTGTAAPVTKDDNIVLVGAAMDVRNLVQAMPGKLQVGCVILA